MTLIVLYFCKPYLKFNIGKRRVVLTEYFLTYRESTDEYICLTTMFPLRGSVTGMCFGALNPNFIGDTFANVIHLSMVFSIIDSGLHGAYFLLNKLNKINASGYLVGKREAVDMITWVSFHPNHR